MNKSSVETQLIFSLKGFGYMFRIESIQRQVFIYNTNIVYGVITYQHTMYDMSTYV